MKVCDWSGGGRGEEGEEERGGGRREEVGDVKMGEEGGNLYVLYSTLCDHIILHTPTPSHPHTLIQYSQALRSVTAKLFADLEIKKKHLEDRDQSER